MNNCGVLVILCVAFSEVVSNKHFGSDYGDYAISYTGLYPTSNHDNEYIEWDGELTIVDKRWRDKRLSGDCTIKKKLQDLGMSVTFNQKAAGPFGEESKWASFKIEDVCENSMGLEYFQQRFTRKDSNEPALDLETCTIEPGEYTLSNWTIEPHMKKKVGEGFPYGFWGVEVTISGNEGEETIDYATIKLELEIQNKKARDHQRQVRGKHGKGNKHNENEPDHPDYPDPEDAKEKFETFE